MRWDLTLLACLAMSVFGSAGADDRSEEDPALRKALLDMDAMRNGSSTRYAELERMGRELLARYDRPDQRAKIYFELAHVYAQSGIDIHPERVTRHARLALEAEKDPIQRGILHTYLGCAAEVDRTLDTFPERRRSATGLYLAGYKELLALDLPKVLPELPAPPPLDDVDGPDTEAFRAERARATAKREAYAKQRRERQRTGDLMHQRDILANQVVQLYRREPADDAELRRLAAEAALDAGVIEAILSEVHRK